MVLENNSSYIIHHEDRFKMSALYRMPLTPFFFIFSLAYLILAMHLPVSIITGAGHDDALFWGHAYQILKGNWLGSYSQMTLAKGPAFSFFLAMNAVLGIPITLSTALLYLFSCSLISNTLGELGLKKYLVLTSFVIILFHPELYPIRIIRDIIYPALSLIIIAGAIKFVFIPLQRHQLIKNLFIYGSVFGFFWITREEGIWIFPGLLTLLILKAFQLKKLNLPIHNVFYRFACFSFIAVIILSLIALINYLNYGKFEVVDFKGKAFSQALKSLNSVDVGPNISHVPVSFYKRQEIYKISPTFSELKDYFEDYGKGWTSFGCEIYSWTCGDYAGGWFAWALRDAVASKGYYQNPERAAEFYTNITKEIKTACNNGIIKCRTNLIPFMPNITMTQLNELPGKTIDALKLAMVQFPVPATGGASWEPLEQLQKISQFLGNPHRTLALSEEKVVLEGWFYSANTDWLILNCSVNGTKTKRDVKRLGSPDIADHFKDLNANFQRFSINIPINENCSISSDSLASFNLPINGLIKGKQKSEFEGTENGILYIDQILRINNDSIQYLPFKIKILLGSLYKIIIPTFVFGGAISFFIYLIFALTGRAPITDIFIVSTSMWCLFFSRIFILILVDISSFPAINELYMSAAFPILCLAAFLSLQLLFSIKKKFGHI